MDLVVAADDRTGAIETAGALADAGGRPVAVVTDHTAVGRPIGLKVADDVIVVDLGSRHLTGEEAGRRAGEVATVRSQRAAHKIDSTLRGNWAAELVARHRTTGMPVAVVAALPALGRTCVDGIVLEHGRPVHLGAAAHDVGRTLASSEPAELLVTAGAVEVTTGRRPMDVAAWLRDPSGFLVCDAATQDDLDVIAASWRDAPEVLLAGTSAVIAASRAPSGTARPAPLPHLDGAVLVVCGSVNPVARVQVERAALAGAVVGAGVDRDLVEALRHGHPVVVAPPLPVAAVDPPSAATIARSLAATADELCALAPVAVLVVIGGDTAATLLGPRPFAVHGTVGPGTPWGVDERGRTVITRAGGFGGQDALVELLWATLSR